MIVDLVKVTIDTTMYVVCWQTPRFREENACNDESQEDRDCINDYERGQSCLLSHSEGQ